MALKAHVGFPISGKCHIARSITDHFCGLEYQLAQRKR